MLEVLKGGKQKGLQMQAFSILAPQPGLAPSTNATLYWHSPLLFLSNWEFGSSTWT